jgi:hypothetical protein
MRIFKAVARDERGAGKAHDRRLRQRRSLPGLNEPIAGGAAIGSLELLRRQHP